MKIEICEINEFVKKYAELKHFDLITEEKTHTRLMPINTGKTVMLIPQTIIEEKYYFSKKGIFSLEENKEINTLNSILKNFGSMKDSYKTVLIDLEKMKNGEKIIKFENLDLLVFLFVGLFTFIPGYYIFKDSYNGVNYNNIFEAFKIVFHKMFDFQNTVDSIMFTIMFLVFSFLFIAGLSAFIPTIYKKGSYKYEKQRKLYEKQKEFLEKYIDLIS